jgi:lon-related putative ATP-dependent protease
MAGDPTQDRHALTPDRLYRTCDAGRFRFRTTAEVGEVRALSSQPRAFDAVSFAVAIKERGYNLFVLGPPGSGKHWGVRDFLRQELAQGKPPSDWVYVNNFKTPHRPIAIELAPGRGTELSDAMEALIEDLRTGLPAVFESEDYQNRQGSIETALRQRQEEAFEALNEEAARESIAVVRTPQGFAMAPAPGGEVIKPEAFNALPAEERAAYEARVKALQEKLATILKSVPRWQKERRDQLRALNREVAGTIVENAVEELRNGFSDVAPVLAYLDELRADLIENALLFLAQDEEQSPFAGTGLADGRFDRYRVNTLVDRSADATTPVVAEDHPTLGNLVGRVEHLQQQGALVTNFRLIKAGSLHHANGGYLLIDARSILTEPFAWQALKRALRVGAIRIESLGEQMSSIHTITLEPDPIPLDVKVVLFGDRQLYYLLSELDPDMRDLFKVMADFDDTAEWTDAGEDLYASLIAAVARRQELRPLDAGAVARAVEQAARNADDAQKISLHIGPLADLLREANYWAGSAASRTIGRAHIQRAIDERLARADRIRTNSQEMILRDIAMIDTDGEAVGQINGLSVLSLGEGTFGRPSRITARVRVGTGTVVDIEREVELGGPLHSKGVLILSGFLQARYALDVPISLAASLVFEQSYGGVDGDSASSAELYALLSALSGVPIRQSVAVTGSVNQLGEVQAIGGANHKIEGFFDICAERGLTGGQGVIIPQSNVQHLMLRHDVVEACRAGRFRVWSVATIDQGIEVLTGRPAGERAGDGGFPDGSISRLVEDRLISFARSRRAFGAGPGAHATADPIA